MRGATMQKVRPSRMVKVWSGICTAVGSVVSSPAAAPEGQALLVLQTDESWVDPLLLPSSLTICAAAHYSYRNPTPPSTQSWGTSSSGLHALREQLHAPGNPWRQAGVGPTSVP